MRRSGRPTALALIDIDHFKTINDTYGHRTATPCSAVADVIAHACRATDEPARYGGDELAVILAETDLDGARTIGESIRRAVERARAHAARRHADARHGQRRRQRDRARRTATRRR